MFPRLVPEIPRFSFFLAPIGGCSFLNPSSQEIPMQPRPLLLYFSLSIVIFSGAAFAVTPASLKDLPPAVYGQLAQLTGSDSVLGSQFGYSVAVSSDGNTIVVGAYSYYDGSEKDAAYVFVKPSTGWANATETAELTPSDDEPGNPFGISVAISGDTIFVGSKVSTLVTDFTYTYGAVYVYTEPSTGWANMTETAKLTVNPSCDCSIGELIAAGGNSLVSSAVSASTGYPAGMFVWNKPTAGWSKEAAAASLVMSDNNVAIESVAMSTTGNTIALGSGSIVYVYAKPSGGWSGKAINQTAELITSDGNPGDGLGSDVALTDTTVAAGAPGRNDDQGAIYVYEKPSGGWGNAEENAQLSSADGPYLGWSVGIVGNTIVAGSPFANVNGNYQGGAIFLYNKPANGWKTTSQYAQELSASDGNEGAELGSTLAFGGTTIVAGAPNMTIGSNTLQGSAYVFGQ
jgi:hypothetical protein